MQPADFVAKWYTRSARANWYPDYLERGRLISVAAVNEEMTSETTRFLREAGLPQNAAPYLSFDDLARGLRRIYEVYGPQADWSAHERERLKPYLILGSDGSGNPICLDLANGDRIVWLDHERRFAITQFINSSVGQLAECLLVYSQMLETFQQADDEKADVDDLSLDLIEEIVERLHQIDADALREGCFWQQEMEGLAVSASP
jgi:hypothetical protein